MSDPQDLDPDPKYKEIIPALREVDVKDHDPLQDMLYVRNARGLMLKAVAGQGIPRNTKDMQLVMTLLKDMDGAALGQMRIKSDEKGQDLQSQHQALVRTFLAGAGGFKAPLREANENTAAPSLDDAVETREFVPGELTQGTVNSTYEEFVARTGELQLAAVDVED